MCFIYRRYSSSIVRLFEEDRPTSGRRTGSTPTWPSVCTFHLNAALALSSRRAMQQCLNRQVTKSKTCGDLFKLVVPVGWTMTAFMATLAYCWPHCEGRSHRGGVLPHWCLCPLLGLGSLAIYNFHRTASYHPSNADKGAVKRKNVVPAHPF